MTVYINLVAVVELSHNRSGSCGFWMSDNRSCGSDEYDNQLSQYLFYNSIFFQSKIK